MLRLTFVCVVVVILSVVGGPATGGGKGKRKPVEEGTVKKRRRPMDDYDSEDSFIDDSDIKAQEQELRKTKVKTKHDGFVVHSDTRIAPLLPK